jgi:NADP-dependent aldehyde dehydrogenase
VTDRHLHQKQIPIGPVAVFGAGNFPYAFSTAGNDTISALAAGCTVVYKSHPGHPLTSLLTTECIETAIEDTGMPRGIFSILNNNDQRSGRELVMQPGIKAVGFTGSLRGGRALYDLAAQRPQPIPVYAEMGSVNPVFVLPGILRAGAEGVAEKLVASNLLNAGQFCTNPGLIISIKGPDTDRFLSHYAGRVCGAMAETMLTEAIWDGYATGIQQLESLTKQLAKGEKGDAVLPGMPQLFETDGQHFLANALLLQEEVFGPCTLHVTVEDAEEMMVIAQQLQGQLTASVWGNEEDKDLADQLQFELEEKAGRLIYNQVPTGVELSPAMMHGGPYPASTNAGYSSIGVGAIYRFVRRVCYQGWGAQGWKREREEKY